MATAKVMYKTRDF